MFFSLRFNSNSSLRHALMFVLAETQTGRISQHDKTSAGSPDQTEHLCGSEGRSFRGVSIWAAAHGGLLLGFCWCQVVSWQDLCGVLKGNQARFAHMLEAGRWLQTVGCCGVGVSTFNLETRWKSFHKKLESACVISERTRTLKNAWDAELKYSFSGHFLKTKFKLFRFSVSWSI